MNKKEFFQYVQVPAIYDGSIVSVTKKKKNVSVAIKRPEGTIFSIEFSNVDSVRQAKAVGMKLNALIEYKHLPPLRLFSFSSRERAEPPVELEIIAQDVKVLS